MEAFALAKVCRVFEVPFAAVKYLSNAADQTAKDDWRSSLCDCAITLNDVAVHLTSG